MTAIKYIHSFFSVKQSLFRLAEAFSIFASAQLIVQGMMFISGLLAVHLLPQEEYAYYILANTMLGMMAVLADGGVSNGVMAIGGRSYQDPRWLGSVINTGLSLRKSLAIKSSLIATPLLIYFLREHGAPWNTTLFLAGGCLISLYISLNIATRSISYRLHQELKGLSYIQATQAPIRLMLIFLGLIAIPLSYAAVFLNIFSQAWEARRIKLGSQKLFDSDQPADPLVREEIIVVIRRSMPGLIYYSLSGQVTVWLISTFGNTTAIAEVGALGRVGLLFNFLGVILFGVAIPRFARLPAQRTVLLLSAFLIVGGTAISSIAAVTLIACFPQQTLWLLGPKYIHLKEEIVLAVAAPAAGLLTGIVQSLGASRGWIVQPSTFISAAIVWQLALIPFLDLGSVKDVLWLGILCNIVPFLIYVGFLYKKITETRDRDTA